MTRPATDAASFGWLLDTFVANVAGVCDALVVSADGLLMTVSSGLDRTGGDQLAAIVAGINSLTRGAARQLGGGQVRQAVVEMDDRYLFAMSVSDGSVLAVVADPSCDVGVVGYEMALLVTRTEATLTPQLVAQMRAQLPVGGPLRAAG